MSSMLATETGLNKEEILRCPGCENWQLHYTLMALADLIDWTVTHPSRGQLMSFDTTAVDECIEVILRDHVAHECSGARRVMELWRKMQR